MLLEFIILGSGTSHGVPVIGVEYPADFLANPKNHRMRPALFIRDGELSLVIDTPPEFRLQVLREGIKHLDAVLVTHGHADHIMGMDDCRRFCELRGRPLPIYASAETMHVLRRVFAYAFEAKDVPLGYFNPEPREIDGPFALGSLQVIPIKLPHGRTNSTGFLFCRRGRRLLAYLTDAKSVPKEAIEQLRGVGVMIIDALRPEPHPQHMCLSEALEVVKQVRPARAILTHLTHDYDHDRDQARLPGGVELAFDGLRGGVD